MVSMGMGKVNILSTRYLTPQRQLLQCVCRTSTDEKKILYTIGRRKDELRPWDFYEAMKYCKSLLKARISW
jgi:hypothetical protein